MRRGISAAERKRIARVLERAANSGAREAERIVREIYERVRDLPPDEVIELLREVSRETSERLARAAKKAFLSGGQAGLLAVAYSDVPPQRLYRMGAEGLRAAWDRRGGLQLSTRIHRQGSEMLTRLEQCLTMAMREGEGALEIARRMRDDFGHMPRASVTRLLHEVERKARAAIVAGGDPRAFEAWGKVRADLRGYSRQLLRAETGMGAATEHALAQIERAVKRGNKAGIDRAVRWWTYDRRAYQQRVIARTETARGFTEGYKANAAEAPWVVGWQWNVETVPGRQRDICDVLGNQNLYGLGPGCYPFDKVPELPAHPNCNCYLTEVIDESVGVDDERPAAPPRRQGATATWLRGQPADTQREILGERGYAAFVASRGRTIPPSVSAAAA